MKTTNNEKIDPLARIQEEIKEVVRREQEYRQLTSSAVTTPTTPPIKSSMDVAATALEFESYNNNNDSNNDLDSEINNNDNTNTNTLTTANGSVNGLVAARPVTTSLLVVPEDNNLSSSNPSLVSSVNSKEESFDEQHSDDSGISASSLSKAKGAQSPTNLKLNIGGVSGAGVQQQRYIGPNCYNMTPEPPQQKLMTRTISTPHLNGVNPKARQFTFNTSTKGVMQRFIASRGKLQLNGSNGTVGLYSPTTLGSATAAAVGGQSPSTASGNANGNTLKLNNRSALTFLDTHTTPVDGAAPAIIERDSEGRPLRPGYVPVELKIQRELKDLKSRESELKKIRKIRQSTPDLLDSLDKENLATDDEDDDSDVEHCYGPGKLRSAKSISELCDANLNQHSNGSLSSSTPSPDLDHSKYALRTGNMGGGGVGGGMRPAMSLAQLCDLDPEEAPSSHRLIAQWESLIQQNA